ncbi:hypothetical protein [Carboxylicivirga linearis]|uniref:Metanogen output domain-containing protein n=1 Tax=Carboxylicivirga linearis TaxID=1628157 RepID=A0ABS5JXY8_9BACT|nr:hypothetical protein [Carboxylicivirga linearis]MBS2099286.1 hypothetical protein [Carboxylicivirga linearis]
MNRKDFLKKACISTACFCGFGAVASAASDINTEPEEKEDTIQHEWLANLLENLGEDMDEELLRPVIKKASEVHYNQLKMDEMLSSYVGDIDAFIQFIQKEWAWNITYNKDENIILADENKPHCVCPVLPFKKGKNTSAICYCSEGFAERMFSYVLNKPVQAEVISSVRRGDSTCIYQINV